MQRLDMDLFMVVFVCNAVDGHLLMRGGLLCSAEFRPVGMGCGSECTLNLQCGSFAWSCIRCREWARGIGRLKCCHDG
jgi:hypothetical protein